ANDGRAQVVKACDGRGTGQGALLAGGHTPVNALLCNRNIKALAIKRVFDEIRDGPVRKTGSSRHLCPGSAPVSTLVDAASGTISARGQKSSRQNQLSRGSRDRRRRQSGDTLATEGSLSEVRPG